MLKICAGIITYNPDVKIVDKSIKLLLPQVERIYIFDNGSKNIAEIRSLVNSDFRIILIEQRENLGIATALNKIMKYAENDNNDFVLTLDHDSLIPVNYVESIFPKVIEDNVAVICPKIYDRNRKEFDKSGKFVCSYKEDFSRIDKCITSGALTRVSAWKKVGGYDEILFIDNVDFEFCYRIINSGFLILRNDNVQLNHSIGVGEKKQFLFWNITVHNHNEKRKYYICRNIIYVDFKKNKKIKLRSFASIIKLLLITLFFEKNKIEKCKAIFRGIKDGIGLIGGTK